METQFSAEFDVNVCTKDESQEFMTEFSEITSTSYNKLNQPDLVDSKYVQWSGKRKCIHKIQKVTSKKTNEPKPGCEAFIKFKLSKVYSVYKMDKIFIVYRIIIPLFIC